MWVPRRNQKETNHVLGSRMRTKKKKKKASLSKFQPRNQLFGYNINWQNRLCKNFETNSNMSNDLITANVSTRNTWVYIFTWVAKMDSCVAKDYGSFPDLFSRVTRQKQDSYGLEHCYISFLQVIKGL